MKREVCRECYLKNMPGQPPETIERAWDEFGVAWFDNLGYVECPTEVLRKGIDSSSERIFAITKDKLSDRDMSVLQAGMDLLRSKVHSQRASTKGQPPAWCPYKRKHWGTATEHQRKISWK